MTAYLWSVNRLSKIPEIKYDIPVVMELCGFTKEYIGILNGF